MSGADDRLAALMDLLADLPPAAVLTGTSIGDGRSADMSTTPGVRPLVVFRPGSVDELSRILAVCHALHQPVVTQGGLTGLAGGASPAEGEVALSLERFRAIEPLDADTGSVLCGAGVALATLQATAANEGYRFPIDLGSRGTATVGGMVATNAGGIRAMRHGMMRDQILGLEVVLADGTVLSRLGTLAKDNSGFDLKHLFCGTEGTLGIVTRARLALQPQPRLNAVALIALPDLAAAQTLLQRLRRDLGAQLSAFEFIERRVYAAVAALGQVRTPLASGSDMGLIEIEGIDGHDVDAFQAALADAVEAGLATDALIGTSAREQDDLWALRDGCSQMIFTLSDTWGFDIGVDAARLRPFLSQTEAQILTADPDARLWLFGHLGDGNIHFIVTTRHPSTVADIVYAAIRRFGGALSAEHGLGREKAAMLSLVRSDAEIATMRRLKAALDPHAILNPGRVLPAEAP